MMLLLPGPLLSTTSGREDDMRATTKTCTLASPRGTKTRQQAHRSAADNKEITCHESTVELDQGGGGFTTRPLCYPSRRPLELLVLCLQGERRAIMGAENKEFCCLVSWFGIATKTVA